MSVANLEISLVFMPIYSRFKDPIADHKAFVYYNCDDCEMRTDDKWIDVETVEQSGASWWTANDTKAQLGIVKSAGVNIVLFRERGGRQCGDHMHSGFEWIKNNSQVISNTYVQALNYTSDWRYSGSES